MSAITDADLARTLLGLFLRAILAALPAAAILVIRVPAPVLDAMREATLHALLFATPAFLVAALVLHEGSLAGARRAAAGLPVIMAIGILVGGLF